MTVARFGIRFFFTLALAACGEGDEAGAVRAAVHNGAPSDVTSVVWVIDTGGGARCSGVVVGDRWVLTPDFCTASDEIFVVIEENPSDGTPIAVVAVHEGPAIAAGSGTVSIDLVEVSAPLGVTPIALSDSTPAVGDLYTIVGFGAQDGAGSTRTEGTFRVTAVTEDELTLEPEGEVAGCNSDHVVLDLERRLAGTFIYGTPHATLSGCLQTGIAVRVELYRDFVEATLPEAPDAGTGAPDAGEPDADAGMTSGDSGPPTAADGGSGDGCGCATSRTSGTPLPLLLAWLAISLRRRRWS